MTVINFRHGSNHAWSVAVTAGRFGADSQFTVKGDGNPICESGLLLMSLSIAPDGWEEIV
jgi:hypothetical protein